MLYTLVALSVQEQGVKARGRMGEMMRTWKGSRHALIGDFLKMFGPVTGPIVSTSRVRCFHRVTISQQNRSPRTESLP